MVVDIVYVLFIYVVVVVGLVMFDFDVIVVGVIFNWVVLFCYGVEVVWGLV